MISKAYRKYEKNRHIDNFFTKLVKIVDLYKSVMLVMMKVSRKDNSELEEETK